MQQQQQQSVTVRLMAIAANFLGTHFSFNDSKIAQCDKEDTHIYCTGGGCMYAMHNFISLARPHAIQTTQYISNYLCTN